jgi:RsiW-degrading membrane proteinase PrsW (M82 family)
VLPQSRYDHLLMGSPLRRRSVCLGISAFLVTLLAFASLVHLALFASLRSDVVRVFLQALALSSLLAVVPLTVIWFLDRRERESWWLFAAAFLWGGCIATAIALPFNSALFQAIDAWVAQNPRVTEVLGPDAALMISAPLSAPLSEELAKGLGVLLLFWLLRAEFDNMRDGLVYGALIGAGFNWFEAALYVAQGYAKFGVAPFALQLAGRYALFGLGGHAMFTAIFGAFLGFALQTRYGWLRLLAPLAGLALAVAAHLINNALPLFAVLVGEPPPRQDQLPDIGFLEAFAIVNLTQLTVFVPFLLVAGLALWRSGVWERRVIREELADEVGRTVSPDEYQGILADHMLRTRRIDRIHPRTSAALVNAQHELAFRKRRVRDQGGDPQRDVLVAAWRDDIRHLRHGVQIETG